MHIFSDAGKDEDGSYRMGMLCVAGTGRLLMAATTHSAGLPKTPEDISEAEGAANALMFEFLLEKAGPRQEQQRRQRRRWWHGCGGEHLDDPEISVLRGRGYKLVQSLP